MIFAKNCYKWQKIEIKNKKLAKPISVQHLSAKSNIKKP
jgi:hypothetical protein